MASRDSGVLAMLAVAMAAERGVGTDDAGVFKAHYNAAKASYTCTNTVQKEYNQSTGARRAADTWLTRTKSSGCCSLQLAQNHVGMQPSCET